MNLEEARRNRPALPRGGHRRWRSTRTCGTTIRSRALQAPAGPRRCSASRCWPRSTCGRSRTGCRGRSGWAGSTLDHEHPPPRHASATGSATRSASSPAPGPTRGRRRFAHEDGIYLYILEYANGCPGAAAGTTSGPGRAGRGGADIGIRWRVEGTDGLARGTIGWPSYPERTPSTLDYTTTAAKRNGIRRDGTRCGFPTPSSGRWRNCSSRWKRSGSRPSAARIT